MSMSRMLLRVMHHRSQSGYTSISPSHESWRMHVTDCVWYGKVCHLLLVYFLFSSLLYLSVKREKTKQECAWSIVNIQPATNRMYGYCTVLCVIVHIYFTISRYFLRVCNNVSLAIFVVVAFFFVSAAVRLMWSRECLSDGISIFSEKRCIWVKWSGRQTERDT